MHFSTEKAVLAVNSCFSTNGVALHVFVTYFYNAHPTPSNMNHIVLLGNGFDLAHGLKTSYTDFLLWYFKKVLDRSKDEHSLYIHSDDLFDANFSERSFDSDGFNSITEILKSLMAANIHYSYKNAFFERIVTAKIGLNWVGIEAEYYAALLSIYKELEKHKVDRCFLHKSRSISHLVVL